MDRLDVGSGRSKMPGYTTVDNDPMVKPDILCDIELLGEKIPQSTIEEIRAHHILEHLPADKKVTIMAELYKLLKVGGILDIEVPNFPHPASVQDPTHLSFWCKDSFWYFTKGNRFGEAFAKRHSTPPVPLFHFVEDGYRGDPPWAYWIKLRK